MNNILDTIYNYATHLRREHSLYISFHFPYPYYNPFYTLPKFTPFVIHSSPYCLKIKCDKKNNRKCLRCQKLVLNKLQTNPSFIGSCHADVCEYIHGIKYDGKYVGFISVGPYISENPRLKKDSETAFFYTASIKKEIPSIKFFDAIISPIAIMIELFIKDFWASPAINNLDYVKILDYITTNYKTVTLDDICNDLNYSQSYVSHLFKKINGHNIREYANILKVNNAKNLLKTTSLSIGEIATLSGFNTISYFTNTFAHFVGESPLKYRTKRKL